MMSKLVTIRTCDLGDGVSKSVSPDKLLEGVPVTTAWEQDKVEGKVRTGVWEMTPGVIISIKGNVYEYCHILEGEIEITPEDGAPKRYRGGDHFVMKPGFRGTWRTIEAVRKVFVTIE